MPVAFHTINLGIDALLQYKESKMDLLAPSKTSQQTQFFREAHRLKNEIAKVFYSIVESNDLPNKNIPLLVTGHGKRILHLEEFVTGGFAECYSHLLAFDKQDLKPYAICLGLAYDALAKDPQSLQFRQGAFLSDRHKKKLINVVVSYFLVCLIATLALYFYSRHHLQQNRKLLDAQIDLAIKKDASRLQKPLMSNDSSSLEERLQKWEKTLQKENKPCPYLLQAPLVTDVLTWLLKHPILQSDQAIQIADMQYELIQYPKIETLSDPYLAKLTLEVNFPTEGIAHNFHESLLQGEGWVNPQLEITWESLDNKTYKTSFYLKQNEKVTERTILK